jgi:hypothetical protein
LDNSIYNPSFTPHRCCNVDANENIKNLTVSVGKARENSRESLREKIFICGKILSQLPKKIYQETHLHTLFHAAPRENV